MACNNIQFSNGTETIKSVSKITTLIAISLNPLMDNKEDDIKRKKQKAIDRAIWKAQNFR